MPFWMLLVRRLMTNTGTTPRAGSRPHHVGSYGTETVMAWLGILCVHAEALEHVAPADHPYQDPPLRVMFHDGETPPS